MKFTVQYRKDTFDPWKLVRASSGVDIGEFIVPTKADADSTIDRAIAFQSGWKIEELDPVNSTRAWQITSMDLLAKSAGEDTALSTKAFGSIKRQLRFMAITRIEPFWMGCEHDREYFFLSNDGLLLSFLNDSGQCITLLALNSVDDFYTVFRTGTNGEITVAGRNDSSEDAPLQIIAAISPDKQASLAAAMSQARAIRTNSPKLKSFLETCQSHGKKATEPAFFDTLGYCTWNGLGQDLTREKLLDGLDRLAANNVTFNTLLIDDNWQSLGKTKLDFSNPGFRGMARFEANVEGFPGGLASLISEIKKRYPHIQYIGVWHALFGYWGGLSHDSELKDKYNTRMLRARVRMNTPTDVLIIDPEDVHRFYDDFYSFLKSCGVDFVKTDVQHMLGQLIDPRDRRDVPAAYQSAWNSAYLKHFDGRAISCMSQIPQISFHSFLQTETPKILLRNSDDFFPEIPGSHPFHLFVNAHNALLTQHLNCLPDWDMFQTSHAYSSYHGAARAISGGPVLITDEPGSHDVGLIDEMTALSPSGTRIAIRPGMATAVDMWDSFAAGQILKIGATTSSGAGILGLFNVSEGQREALISVEELFSGQKLPENVLVRSYKTGQVFVPKTQIERLTKVKLPMRGWHILTGFTIARHKETDVAILGLTNKISGAAAVTAFNISGNVIGITLKALGKLGLYIGSDQVLPERIVVNRDHEIDPHDLVREEVPSSGHVFTVDVEKLWREKNLWSQRAETIDVEVTLSK